MKRESVVATQDMEELLLYFEAELTGHLDWLASFTREGEPGVTRLLYTQEWLAAQKALERKLANMGLETEFDEVGNLFGKLRGELRETSIITGSHIDTVAQGGKYDGAFGIAAAVVALEYLQRAFGRPKRTLEVVSLCEEEGSRFPIAYWGSGSIAGKRSFDQIARLRDADEVGFAAAMRQCGFGEGSGAKARRRDMAAFVELHIEQGAVLEREKLSLGVVDAIAGQRRFKFLLAGEANHVGTTPMRMRRDALEGASAMIGLLRAAALRAGEPLVATVGQLQVHPNVPNVVPGKAEFTVDVRHSDEVELGRFCERMLASFQDIAVDRGLDMAYSEWLREAPAPMDRHLKEMLDDIIGDMGMTSRRMVSGAGHDAQMFQHICPAALLFVPSRKGISHSPDEYTSPRELAIGALVLTELLYRLGYKEEQL